MEKSAENKHLNDEKEEKDSTERIELKTPGFGEHPLQYAYTFWYTMRPLGKLTQQAYNENLKEIGSFASVEQFWNFYGYLRRPCDFNDQFVFHLFKQGIRPMWEDPANKKGGKWRLFLKKGSSSRYWENLILAMIGEQFGMGDEKDVLTLWNRTASDKAVVKKLGDTIKRFLDLPQDIFMQYKDHCDAKEYQEDQTGAD